VAVLFEYSPRITDSQNNCLTVSNSGVASFLITVFALIEYSLIGTVDACVPSYCKRTSVCITGSALVCSSKNRLQSTRSKILNRNPYKCAYNQYKNQTHSRKKINPIHTKLSAPQTASTIMVQSKNIYNS
jgi:hypothetical protein